MLLRPFRNSVVRFIFAFLTLSAGAIELHAEEKKETRSFITADSSKGTIALIGEDGTTKWSHRIGPLHDLQRLPENRVLFQDSWTHLVEVDLGNGKVVWEYEAAKQNREKPGEPIEIHAFQRLDNGSTMIAESGPSRIIEVDQSGKVIANVPLKVRQKHPHHDTRLVRKLKNGNYLVAHEQDGFVREYASNGKVEWEYEVPMFGKSPKPGHGPEAFGNQCFSAVRLENGNTLIASGNGHSIIEVTSAKEIVWKVEQNDLAGITLAWVTTLEVLPSGNIVVGNCHAGPENPQIIELTREKKVVWSFKDFERFGNSLTNTQIVSVDGRELPPNSTQR